MVKTRVQRTWKKETFEEVITLFIRVLYSTVYINKQKVFSHLLYNKKILRHLLYNKKILRHLLYNKIKKILCHLLYNSLKILRHLLYNYKKHIKSFPLQLKNSRRH